MAHFTCPLQQGLQNCVKQPLASAAAASASLVSDTAPQLQPQLAALAVGVVLFGHGDGFCNFTYLVVPLVQNMHPIVDPPFFIHPPMPFILGDALCHDAFI